MPSTWRSHWDAIWSSTVGLVPRVESISLLLNALLFPAAASRRKASGRPLCGIGGGVDVPTNPESRPAEIFDVRFIFVVRSCAECLKDGEGEDIGAGDATFK